MLLPLRQQIFCVKHGFGRQQPTIVSVFCLVFCSDINEFFIMQLFEFLLTIVGSPRFVKVRL